MALHATAEKGFGDAAAYDAHRPSYPPVAVDRFLARLELAGLTGASVIDLAAGTGKLTESLAARPENFAVVAVEPHAGMRGELERKALPRVETKEGFAEKIPVADGWADGVVVAQAFHWFATHEALAEIARVTKPQGTLGLIWNVDEYNKPKSWPATTAWEEALNQLVHALPSDGQARLRDHLWKDVFDSQLPTNPIATAAKFLAPGDGAKAPLYSVPIGEDSEPFTVWLSREALWKRLATLSQIAVLQGAELAAFRGKVDEILQGPSVETNEKGEVLMHGKTYFAWTSRV